MSRGYFVVAQNNAKTDYVRQAYALALSILAQSPDANISVMTNDDVPTKYKKVFDQVIDIPWGDLSEDSKWKINNRWKIYHRTPYRQTTVFDTDMLVLDNLDYTWTSLQHVSYHFTKDVLTYRQEPVTSRYYRKAFDANNLPNPYVAMFQFNKSNETKEFFVLLEIIMKNWKIFYSKYAPNSMQNWCSVDMCAAIALKILGTANISVNNNNMLSFVHLKSHAQNLSNPLIKSTDLTCDVGDTGLFLNGYKQKGVLHYVDDEFLTDEIIDWLEEQV
jgi:hypothetical protein